MSTCSLLRSRALLHQACLFIPGHLRLPRSASWQESWLLAAAPYYGYGYDSASL